MKERIIGAIVLVLFVVLVVPVFLDGPGDGGEIISENVPLPGQAGEETQTIVLNRDRTQPVPAVSGNKLQAAESRETPIDLPQPEKSVPAPQPAMEQSRPDPEPPKPEPSKPQPSKTEPVVAEPAPQSSSTGMWAVQLGSFGNRENADKLAAELRAQKYTAFLSKLSTSEGELHRVRIGPLKDRESAEAVAAQLEKSGRKGQVVPHP